MKATASGEGGAQAALQTRLPGGTRVTACGQAAGQELDCACAVVSPGEDAVGTGLSSNLFNHDTFFIARSL